MSYTASFGSRCVFVFRLSRICAASWLVLPPPPFTLTEGGGWMLIAEGKLEDFVESLLLLLFLLLGEAGSSHYIF